jgi:hypothetical protein
MRWRATVSVSVLELILCSCFTKQKTLVLPPPTPVVAKPLPTPQMEAPPRIDAKMPAISVPPLVLEAPAQPDTPPAKPVPKKRPSTTTPPTTSTPTTPTPPEAEQPTATPPPAPVPTAPQLSEILTDDRRRQYEADFMGSVTRAKAVLSRAAGRNLSTHQKEAVQRINTFLQQAEESKGRDLATALQFARRADLLGEDLQKSLR